MLALAAIPGLPKFSFLLLALVMGGLAWRTPKAAVTPPPGAADAKPTRNRPRKRWKTCCKLDELSLEVGYGLVPWWTASRADNFWPGCGPCVSNLALQLGFIVPPVHITDNTKLKAARVRDLVAGSGNCPLGDA